MMSLPDFTPYNASLLQEEWRRAAQFYEATLGLQAMFQPARERLRALRCDKVLSNPHIYKPGTNGKQQEDENNNT